VANIGSICIKDSEIQNISEISSNCRGTEEYFVNCDGTNQSEYTCSIINDSYKITGLKHSGVIEHGQVILPPSNPSSGGGGGGGSGKLNKVDNCTSSWKCTIWGNCLNNIKTRTCSLIDTKCIPDTNKPIESSSCENNLKPLSNQSADKNRLSPGITGAVIGTKQKVIFSALGFVLVALLVSFFVWKIRKN